MALVCPRLFLVVVMSMGTHCRELHESEGGCLANIFCIYTLGKHTAIAGAGLTWGKSSYCKFIINLIKFYNFYVILVYYSYYTI